MKPSRYNNFFDHETSKVGFNALNNEYVVLEIELYHLLEAAVHEGAVGELQEIHPEFYEFLVEKGFIVNDDLDELEEAKKLVNSVDSDDSLYELHINPTMNCNFKCWYCYETHIKDSKMSAETIDNVVAHTRTVMNDKIGLKRFNLNWFGGEPLLFFDRVMHPLLKAISEQALEKNVQFNCGITTNGLLINEKVIQISKLYGLNSFQITLDGNREQHDKVRFISEGNGSYDRIVDNIKLLAKHRLNASVRINVSEKTLNGLNEILFDFLDVTETEKPYISFSFHKVWQVEADLEDSITQSRNVFRDSGFVVSYGAYDTVRDSCYGDRKNHATINYNGDVYKCTARDYSAENKEGVLNNSGTITWNEKYGERLSSKFQNKPCLSCSIMPICNGGCSQQALEHKGVDYCVQDFDEEKKKQLVMNLFYAKMSV
jgi:uncharacterized protein